MSEQLPLPDIEELLSIAEAAAAQGVTVWAFGPPPFAGWWETHDPTSARKTTQMRWYFNGHTVPDMGWSYPVYSPDALRDVMTAGSVPNQNRIMWRGLTEYPVSGYEYAVMIIPAYWDNTIKGQSHADVA